LADAERMVAWATDNDAKRVLEMNERVAANLRKIVATLEGQSTLIDVPRLVQVEQS
jgi:hypothetical protein